MQIGFVQKPSPLPKHWRPYCLRGTPPTVDDKAAAERLIKLGVDFITSNILE